MHCMTLKAVKTFYFLSHFGVWAARWKAVFSSVFSLRKREWLGAESNRRHVDFQSTALPTELPSRDGADRGGAVGFSLCSNVIVGQPPLAAGLRKPRAPVTAQRRRAMPDCAP